ncbi:MAG TPA: hypothetical protein VK685_10870 [Candidatus Acidoferrum sp.]|jgi:integrase|nr:hypothetical protein [Candidatus Acidoferrum sp.]
MGEHKRWLHPMADHPKLELRVYQSCYVPERATFQVREFGEFLGSEKVSLLKDINKLLVERFKCWRLQRIHRKKFARGASSLTLDVAILHRIFSFAMENDFVLANPVRMEDRPGDNPQGGAEPFTAEELGKLRENAANDLLPLLLLRWTGLRGSDAVGLTWQEVDFT